MLYWKKNKKKTEPVIVGVCLQIHPFQKSPSVFFSDPV